MKTKKSLLVLLAITLMLALVFTACGDGGGSSNNTVTDTTNGVITGSGGTPEKPVGNVYLGETLKLSGQVYTFEGTETAPIFKPFTGNLQNSDLKIDDSLDGSGDVKNGMLNYTIGEPKSLKNVDSNNFYFLRWYSDVQLSRNDVKGFLFDRFVVDSQGGAFLSKGDYQVSISGNTFYTFSVIEEGVNYIYVEEDINISGKGETVTIKEGTTKTNDFSIALKKGWNAVYTIYEEKGTFSGTIDNPSNLNDTSTESVFLSNPALKWVVLSH